MKEPLRLPLRTLGAAATIGTIALLVSWNQGGLPKATAYHSDQEHASFRDGFGLASGANYFFRGSGDCYGCHGPDNVGPVFANTTSDGRDVNNIDAWRSTMMANSARDPFWRAKVSHEVTVNPAHQVALEDKCTSCHAPMGRHDYHLAGIGPYGIADLMDDPIAKDGVSCLACHMQEADSLGKLFSGNLKFNTLHQVYGPYENPVAGPMSAFFSITPIYSEHITSAGVCAGCHTLITETADLDGNHTGDRFVEQATYHEWVNSSFNTDADPENGLSCQACHMPRIDEGIVISALYDNLTPRSPFGQHQFAGANVFMLRLLKQNINPLMLTASSTQFDTTIARTHRMLKQHSLLLEAEVVDRNADEALIDVTLTNLAGHKFPSGYPARRAFIELLVKDGSGNTIFHNGYLDPDGDIHGHDAAFEPHHDVITGEDQPQIYEMVMGDVNGDKTTVLERAKTHLKDNRLVPAGFSSSHYTADTTAIVGVPAEDIDFNRGPLGQEGSGTDITHYRVPMNGYAGLITVEARVWYESAPRRWMQELFAMNTTEVNTFRDMFNAADHTPVLVKEASVTDFDTGVDRFAETGLRIFPNPVRDGVLRIDGIDGRTQGIAVYDLRGKLVARHTPNGERTWTIAMPAGAATSRVVAESGGRRFTQRVVVP
jgi:hypothetical protein